MDLIINATVFAAGAIAGILYYRYNLKNHPGKLQGMLDELKRKAASGL